MIGVFTRALNDATPEKLIDILDKQGGRITICSAEGNLFDLLTAKNDRGTTLIESLLKGYSGDRITIDRIGRESNIIENPHVSTVQTIQPCVLAKIIANYEYAGRGLNSRFLFVKCNSNIGKRTATSSNISEYVKTKYYDLIYSLLDLKKETTFYLSQEAEDERRIFFNVVERRLVNNWNYMRDFGAKFMGTTTRIAGLIHGVEDRNNAYISGETFKRAIEIAECLGKHAENIYSDAGADETIGNAKYILKRLEIINFKSPISKRELHALCQKFQRKVDELNKAINLLVEHGYIKSIKEENGNRGRPAEWIYINPKLKS